MRLGDRRPLALAWAVGFVVALAAGAAVVLLWGAVADPPFLDLEGEQVVSRVARGPTRPVPEPLRVIHSRAMGPEYIRENSIVRANGTEGYERTAISALVPLSEGDMLYADLVGRVGLMKGTGEVLPDLVDLEAYRYGEWGLVGMDAEPNAEGHTVYAFFVRKVAEAQGNPVVVKFDVSRDGEASTPETIVDDLEPLAAHENGHVGGGVLVGEDGLLYITLGENEDMMSAQDLGTTGGKVLRLTNEGEPAPGNPFESLSGADPRIYALGLRNSISIAQADDGPGLLLAKRAQHLRPHRHAQ